MFASGELAYIAQPRGTCVCRWNGLSTKRYAQRTLAAHIVRYIEPFPGNNSEGWGYRRFGMRGPPSSGPQCDPFAVAVRVRVSSAGKTDAAPGSACPTRSRKVNRHELEPRVGTENSETGFYGTTTLPRTNVGMSGVMMVSCLAGEHGRE